MEFSKLLWRCSPWDLVQRLKCWLIPSNGLPSKTAPSLIALLLHKRLPLIACNTNGQIFSSKLILQKFWYGWLDLPAQSFKQEDLALDGVVVFTLTFTGDNHQCWLIAPREANVDKAYDKILSHHISLPWKPKCLLDHSRGPVTGVTFKMLEIGTQTILAYSKKMVPYY